MDIQKPIAPYLIEKKNIVKIIIFTALFALVFINIYSPFGADKWFNLTKLQFFTYSSLVILTGVMVVVISRIIMYFVYRKRTINYVYFIIWIGAEILSMASFYALFQKFALNDAREFLDLVRLSARNTALVLLLPYSISWLYLSWRDKKEMIDRMGEITSVTGSEKEMIPFYDDRSVLRFSVRRENLLFLESTENYISICYLNNGKITKYLLRDTMKRMEEKFAGSDIIRCHRSYMVNFGKIKVIRKEKDGLKLDFGDAQLPDIPVSRTYVANVMEIFTKYSRYPDGE